MELQNIKHNGEKARLKFEEEVKKLEATQRLERT
jgi:hypothetical protein